VIGRHLNNYEIVSLLGEGGMGTVYLALHPIMGRKAAVKVL
jgi:serine/threonine-protein kinase